MLLCSNYYSDYIVCCCYCCASVRAARGESRHHHDGEEGIIGGSSTCFGSLLRIFWSLGVLFFVLMLVCSWKYLLGARGALRCVALRCVLFLSPAFFACDDAREGSTHDRLRKVSSSKMPISAGVFDTGKIYKISLVHAPQSRVTLLFILLLCQVCFHVELLFPLIDIQQAHHVRADSPF